MLLLFQNQKLDVPRSIKFLTGLKCSILGGRRRRRHRRCCRHRRRCRHRRHQSKSEMTLILTGLKFSFSFSNCLPLKHLTYPKLK